MLSQSDSTTTSSIPQHRRWSAKSCTTTTNAMPFLPSCSSVVSSQSLLMPSGTEDMTQLSNLTTLATRLHNKSVLLAEERNTLHELEHQLAETQALIDEAQRSNREVRRQELHQIMGQHQAELNFFEAQDELAQERSSKEMVEDETTAIKEENEVLQAQWNHELETIFAPHELLLQGFFQRLQGALEVSKQKQETLDRIQSSIRRLKDSRKEMIRDHHAMLDDLTRLKQEERQGASFISDGATQVKQALAQRAELRRQVRDANEKRRQLEIDFNQWEEQEQSSSK